MRSLLNSKEFSNNPQQREVWVRDIIGLMAAVILVAAVVILAGTLAGLFAFKATLPIYILLALILPAWWAANHGAWRWVSPLPVILCFGLGAAGTVNSGFFSISVIYYAIAVILAGMLLSQLMGFLMVGVCILTYTGLGFLYAGFSWEHLPPILTFAFGLAGLALLRWYSDFHLQKALKAQIESNELLKTEIFFREQAEQNQREQEAQLRRLAENATDIITEMDSAGIIRYSSPSCRATLGFAPEALLGTNVYALLHPDDLQTALNVSQAVKESRKPGGLQARVRRADGTYIWMEISGAPLYNEQSQLTGFVLTSRDITQQKQAEHIIQESEKKFRRIIELLPLGVHMYTLQDDDQLIFTGYNPAADTILQLDHAQFLGKSIESCFPGLVEDGTIQQFHEIARHGAIWRNSYYRYVFPPIKGTFEVHAFQTEPGKMVSVFNDITDRIQADEALRLSEAKFSTAFVTSPDSININRLSDGMYIDINQGSTQLLGYTREEMIGKSSLELDIWVDPEDRARLVRGLRENGVVENLEARFRKKSGEIGIGLMSASIIMVQGEPCILSITREISDWIKAQVDLREAHTQLERAYEATLQGWARALELRERETADHSRRVVDLTLQVGRALGLGDEALTELQRGALLHDIGKMGVPDEILLKPGPLDDEEWAIMRLHPDLARGLLSGIDYLHPSISIPYCHHERWDGSGYPQGLKGEDIPLPARIFAVIDVYDALTHNRPYHTASIEEEARAYLIEQRGKQFDPHIVDVFLCLLDHPPA